MQRCAEGKTALLDTLECLMDLEGVPMHGPVHHFIVPAALLTAAAKQSGLAAEILEQKLHTASQRAEKVYLAFVVCGLAAVRRWAAAFSPRSGLRPIRTRNDTGTLSISLLQPVWRMSPRWAARAVASGLPISRWTRPHVSHRSGWESVSVYFPSRHAGATKATRRVGKRAARFIL